MLTVWGRPTVSTSPTGTIFSRGASQNPIHSLFAQHDCATGFCNGAAPALLPIAKGGLVCCKNEGFGTAFWLERGAAQHPEYAKLWGNACNIR